MKKFWIQVTFLIVIILGSLYISFRTDVSGLALTGSQAHVQRKIKINDVKIKVDVADTAKLRSQGFSGRDKLAEDEGMLFIFSESKKYQFWMKGVKFPLDFIYIQDARVVDIIKNVPTLAEGIDDSAVPRYQPAIPVNMVLEVNAGFVDRNNTKVGSQVFEVK